MRCDIIIPVWNLKHYTEQAVESIIKNTDCPYRLIIIDNGSEKETKEYLEGLKNDKRLPGYILIRNEENQGYTIATNQGMEISDAPYVCLHNNDTIVCKGWLREMINVAESSKEIGIVNPNSNNLGTRKPWWMSLDKFAENLMKRHKGQYIEMATAIGFCYLIKREVINKIGILKVGYGLGNFEDTEYCIRAFHNGYKSVFSRGSYVWHAENASFDLVAEYEEMFEKNREMFYEMFGKPQRALYILTKKDEEYFRKLQKETYLMAQKCNWVWIISKFAIGKIPANVHTNISRFRYLPLGFRLRCALRIILKKKKFDRIITDDEALFKILAVLKRFHRGKLIKIQKYARLDDSNFLNLNLGCAGRACYSYVNIDEKISNKKVFKYAYRDLPLEDASVKRILLDHNAVSGKPEAELDAIFAELGRVSIPGCILSIDNFSDKLNDTITRHDFRPLSASYKKLFSVKSFIYKAPFIDNFKGGEISIKVPYMDKGSLAQAVNENGYFIDRLEPKDSFTEIRARKIIQPGPGSKRICAIGQYMLLRYCQLGFDWDEWPRSFEKLGMDYLLLEGMRNQDPKKMRDAILSFKPDYLLVILKDNLNFIKDISLDLKAIGVKVIYWFCDPEHPKKEDLSNVIDAMFLTNRGQLDEYKAAYNLKRVYYMPQGYGPYAQHRLGMKEIYDIGFSGAISNEPLHKTRRELIEAMKSRYQLKISNNIRNNIAEFYSQSKMVFGVSDFDHELYTSNRFFVALGCGACYVTKKFKGIELLAENKKHVLWFETKEELFDILDYYISHDAERSKIREAAERLGIEKHTYDIRVKNVLDIMEGRTDKFYGFL
ncbi:MAG: glycosyltransferase [Candidatus Omnitrophota bacterium]|nr:glycosyltransferase [Candidatus Omnitrophota bacterium]